jgi:hypothetical protein
MKKYILTIVIILLATKLIIGQEQKSDTVILKNTVLIFNDTISEEYKNRLKNGSLFIVSLDDINENTVFLFNDTIYTTLSFDKIERKLNKEKSLHIYTSKEDIEAYINRNNLQNSIISGIADTNKKLLFIIENK